MRQIVIYHANCPDGFCSAWIVHQLYPNAEFLPQNYGDSPPDVEGAQVWILDFSYPRAVMEEMHKKAYALVVLDHHKTAEEALRGLPYCTFDLNRSGATLTWDYFHPGVPRIWLCEYAEDRDLWRWALPDSKEVSAAIRSYPMTFEAWATFGLSRLVSEGRAILRYQQSLVDDICKGARMIVLDGYNVPCVQNGIIISEVTNSISQGHPFGVSWFQREDGMIVCSLRSGPEGVDVSEIARKRGGGGHKHAAGYTVPALEDQYEATNRISRTLSQVVPPKS